MKLVNRALDHRECADENGLDLELESLDSESIRSMLLISVEVREDEECSTRLWDENVQTRIYGRECTTRMTKRWRVRSSGFVAGCA